MGRIAGRIALAATLAFAVRTALRVRRELADHAIAAARVRSRWNSVPAMDGVRRLRIHAHVAEPARSTYPPVVLVHGFGIGGRYLVPLAARLGRHAHVYAPDLPGHGDSDADVQALTIPELADSLAAAMDANRLRAAIVVGHSLGGAFAAELAARRPDLVAGLVLVGPASDSAARGRVGEQLWRTLRSSLRERPTFMLHAARDVRRAGPGVLDVEWRELNAHRIEDVIPRVRAPVRVVRGEHDALVPQRWAEALARLASAPPPTVIPGWGHVVNYDAPDALVKVVFSLVRGLRAEAASVRAAGVATEAGGDGTARPAESRMPSAPVAAADGSAGDARGSPPR